MNKKQLYESIMKNVAKEVKKALNEKKYLGTLSNTQFSQLKDYLTSIIGDELSILLEIDGTTIKDFNNTAIERSMGHIVESYIISKIKESNIFNDVIQTNLNLENSYYDCECDNLKIEIKAYKEKPQNITFTETQMTLINNDKEVFLIFVNYSIKNNCININDILFGDENYYQDGNIISKHGGKIKLLTSGKLDMNAGILDKNTQVSLSDIESKLIDYNYELTNKDLNYFKAFIKGTPFTMHKNNGEYYWWDCINTEHDYYRRHYIDLIKRVAIENIDESLKNDSKYNTGGDPALLNLSSLCEYGLNTDDKKNFGKDDVKALAKITGNNVILLADTRNYMQNGFNHLYNRGLDIRENIVFKPSTMEIIMSDKLKDSDIEDEILKVCKRKGYYDRVGNEYLASHVKFVYESNMKKYNGHIIGLAMVSLKLYHFE